MTGPDESIRAAGPLWTAMAVARRLDVAPGTLRSWARRHGIGPAGHSPGRHRRYTAADVAELDAIRNLIDQGVTVSAAAELVRAQRPVAGVPASGRGASPQAGPTAGRAGIHDLVAAAGRLDSVAALDIVTSGLEERGVLVAWDELCRPALLELDSAVGDDRGCVDSHLLLSWVLATCLRRRADTPGSNPVLLACAPREQHSLGLEVLHAALAERHVPARTLGPDVPIRALTHAVEHLRPRTVVVWAQRTTTAKPDVLSVVAGRCASVLAAGPGWRTSDLPARVTRVDSLPSALALATSSVAEPALLPSGLDGVAGPPSS